MEYRRVTTGGFDLVNLSDFSLLHLLLDLSSLYVKLSVAAFSHDDTSQYLSICNAELTKQVFAVSKQLLNCNS